MKVAITPAGFDNIKSVLENSQVDVEICDISLDELSNTKTLKEYSVVFINCNSDIPSKAKKISTGVAEYVKNGGVVYASDYAAPIIQNIIPTSLKFSNSTSKTSVNCDVLDQGLQSYLKASTVKIDFNMGGWYRVDSLSKDTKVFLKSKKFGPVLCQIPLGSGYIFYTAFHNDAQTDLSKNRMVEFLAIRPLLEQAVTALAESIAEQNAEIRAQQIANLRDDETQKFSFELDRAGRFRLIFQPTYQAQLKVAIEAPGHTATNELNVPGHLEFDSSSPGKVTVTITNLTWSRKGVPLVFALTDNWGGPPSDVTPSVPKEVATPVSTISKAIGGIVSVLRGEKDESAQPEQLVPEAPDHEPRGQTAQPSKETEKPRIRQTVKAPRQKGSIKTTLKK
ncbi:MAG: hypothetical protein AB8F34_07565 [Akkermansiaceae bacterium]